MLSDTDLLGEITKYGYNAFGDQVSQSNPYGNPADAQSVILQSANCTLSPLNNNWTPVPGSGPDNYYTTRTHQAGWPRVIAHPGLPQIRTCRITAYGSSSNSLDTSGSDFNS